MGEVNDPCGALDEREPDFGSQLRRADPGPSGFDMSCFEGCPDVLPLVRGGA